MDYLRETQRKPKFAYGVGDMYAGGAFLVIGLLYLKFLTDVALLDPALAGWVFLIGKIWDAISDPMMGVITDRTKSKHGRRRIYFLAGILPIFLSFASLWITVTPENQNLKFLYYVVAYLFFNTVFTMVMVPYNSLLPNMVKSYQERTKYNVVRMTFSAISAILSGVLPLIIVNALPTITTGYIVMGLIFGAIYAIPWIFVFRGTWELPTHTSNEPATFSSVLQGFTTAFHNKSFRIHASFFVTGQTAVDFLMALFIYYLSDVLHRESEFSAVLGALLVTQLIFMSIHGKIAHRFGKSMPLKIGFVIWFFALLIAMFIDHESPSWIIYLIAILSGIGSSSSTFTAWTILPDISDVDELITGKRREGIYAGMSTFLRKIAQAISTFIIAQILDMIGYDGALKIQSVAVSKGIQYMFFIGPVIFIIIAFLAIQRYKLTEDKHHVIMQEIESRHKGNSPSQDSHVIKICEEVTGLSYDTLLWEK